MSPLKSEAFKEARDEYYEEEEEEEEEELEEEDRPLVFDEITYENTDLNECFDAKAAESEPKG